jgi:hypothetical protein
MLTINSQAQAGLEVNVEKIKYMLMSSHQKSGKNNHIKSCDKVQILGMTVTNKTYIHKNIYVRKPDGI